MKGPAKTFSANYPRSPAFARFAARLYIGKAKNLRQRLASYRVANLERFPRRLLRLLNQITRIAHDVGASESAASSREELLSCVLSPKFNRAGKVWPRKLLHEDDILIYNRTVPKIERTCSNQTAATKITLIGGD